MPSPPPAEGRVDSDSPSGFDPRPDWRVVVDLAARQHAVASRPQLERLGLKPTTIDDWVAGGRLHVVHRGVYAVGHPLTSVDGRRIAAVLAVGEGAALSHRSAASLLDLRRFDPGAFDVVIARRSGRALPGIRVHRVSRLDPEDLTTVRGIPCTSVARTLIDLAAVVNRQTLDRAIERAEILRVLDTREVMRSIDRLRGKRGVAILRAAMLDYLPDSVWTRSELEARFLALCRDARLPRPSVNARIETRAGPLEVDFCWRERRLIVEVDGFETHGTRTAFERDRERGRLLAEAGWQPPLRFSWRQVVAATAVRTTLRRLLLSPD